MLKRILTTGREQKDTGMNRHLKALSLSLARARALSLSLAAPAQRASGNNDGRAEQTAAPAYQQVPALLVSTCVASAKVLAFKASTFVLELKANTFVLEARTSALVKQVN
jgi:hypothetical protein